MSDESTSSRRGSAKGQVSEPREKRRTPFGYVIFSLFVTLLGAAVAAGLALLFATQQLAKDGPLTEARTVAIERGMGTAAIADKLAQNGVVSNRRMFLLAAVYRNRTGNSLKAGEYQFEPGDSMREVLDKITSGKALVYKLTIPEGLTSQQALARIAAHEALTGDAPKILAEGSILPDTYVFTRGRTRAELVEQMKLAQTKLLDELWDKRLPGLQINSREEAIILASIVEKETGVAQERPQVAAVFHNRLLRGMRLQSDPTIIYGIVGGQGKLDRPIRRSEIDRKTPYNTYQIDGLPPTPIANPGREAIAAVLQPANSDALYFVADGTGGHAFAKTLDEHNANVARWRKIEAERRNVAAADAAASTTESTPAPAGEADTEPAVEPDTSTAEAEPSPAEPAETAESEVQGQEDPQPLPDDAGQQVQAAADDTAVSKVPLPRPKPQIN